MMKKFSRQEGRKRSFYTCVGAKSDLEEFYGTIPFWVVRETILVDSKRGKRVGKDVGIERFGWAMEGVWKERRGLGDRATWLVGWSEVLGKSEGW